MVAELAEALACHSVDAEDAVVKRADLSLPAVRDRLLAAACDDLCGQWLRWFFADRATRTISAFSERKMSWAREVLLTSGNRADLEDAHRRWPGDRGLLRRVATIYRAPHDSELTGHAEFLERLAVHYDAPAATQK